jgi:hypothetical protein
MSIGSFHNVAILGCKLDESLYLGDLLFAAYD